MNILQKEQLTNIRDSLLNCISQSSARRANLVSLGVITRESSLQIAKAEALLQNLADDFNLALLEKVITDLQEPRTKIITATNKVNEAITKLEDINKFLGILGTLTAMATTIIKAFSPPGNLLQLSDLLSQIEAFT